MKRPKKVRKKNRRRRIDDGRQSQNGVALILKWLMSLGFRRKNKKQALMIFRRIFERWIYAPQTRTQCSFLYIYTVHLWKKKKKIWRNYYLLHFGHHILNSLYFCRFLLILLIDLLSFICDISYIRISRRRFAHMRKWLFSANEFIKLSLWKYRTSAICELDSNQSTFAVYTLCRDLVINFRIIHPLARVS